MLLADDRNIGDALNMFTQLKLKSKYVDPLTNALLKDA